MVGIRAVFVAAVGALALWSGAGPAIAAPPPWAHGHARAAAQQPGFLAGTIVGIDYTSASITVATPRGIVLVGVTPSTSIYRGNAFASFADINRGAHVDVNYAQIGGRLIAQYIRIR